MKKRIIFIARTFLLIFCLLFSLISCRGENSVSGGELLDREKLAKISESLAATEAETEKIYVTDEAGIVYRTANGTVYHLTKSCPSLANAKEIISCTPEEATAAGIYKECGRCGNGEEMPHETDMEETP